MSKAIDDVIAERKRQIEAEGWTPEHDDTHVHGEMALAASAYAYNAGNDLKRSSPLGAAPRWWPWDFVWWKPKDRRRDLVRAGALIIAEIERLDRASPGDTGE